MNPNGNSNNDTSQSGSAGATGSRTAAATTTPVKEEANGPQQHLDEHVDGAAAVHVSGSGHPDQINQESLSRTASNSPGSSSCYSEMAAKTVENIRRLQENVASQQQQPQATSSGAASGWTGNHQVPPNVSENVQQPLTSGNNPSSQLPSPAVATSATSPLTLSSPPKLSRPPFASPPPPASPLPSISPTLASTFNALVTIDPNWQSNKRSVRERNAVMCNNALMADVYFSVGAEMGEPKKFPAHKYVLATGSTVFYAMFYGGLAEDKDVIEVPDVEPAAFLAMLRYLYCDEVGLDNDNVLATLYCAKRYIVPHLAEECVSFLENSLNAKNACVLLSQSRLFEEPELMQRAWEVIDAQAQAALLADSFSDVDFDTLKAVLARETLNCRETFVFHAALRWSAAECQRRNIEPTIANRREVLGSTMHLIRFPAMAVQEFADEVVKSDILSLQETTDIFMHFTAKEKPRILYPSKTRIGLQMQVCHRFQSSAYRSNQWRYRGRCDSIQFCVDRRVFIVGFGLYGSSSGGSDYTASIELKEEVGDGSGVTSSSSATSSSAPGGSNKATGKSLAENVCKFHSDGSSNTFQVHFDQPVQVEPETFYTASVVLDGAELSYFGQEGMPEVTSGAVTFQFQCSAESTNGTGVQGGQIPELLFYGPPPDSAESNQATLKRRADRLKLKQASSSSAAAASETLQANSTTPTAAAAASDNSQL